MSETKKLAVIITGATGMVGEGVLLECLEHPAIERVLIVNRKPYPLQHPKLKELIVPNFFDLSAVTNQLTGYDVCFFCAGTSSAGMSEAAYTRVTYDLTLSFAQTLARLNPQMIFEYVSGSHTDGTEKGRMMWARVKGKTENDLARLPFQHVYSFRPGYMRPTPGQKNIKWYFSWIGAFYPLLLVIFPNHVSTLPQVARAMIYVAMEGFSKPVLEVKDINSLAKP
jgi:uncharacterized protein YbjT (DUF2867 family)